MKTVFVICLLFACVITISALTPTQQTALSNLVLQARASNIVDSIAILHYCIDQTANGSVVTGTNIVSPDAVNNSLKAEMRGIGLKYGIAATNNRAQIVTIFSNATFTAGSTNAIAAADRAEFWAAYGDLRIIALVVDGAVTNLLTATTFNDSRWGTNNPPITVNDIEAIKTP